MSAAKLTLRSIEPLAEVEIGPAIAAMPKADIHLHAESGPRLDQVLAERSGRRVTDWRAHAHELVRSLPPGMRRLETWGPDLPFPRARVDELDRDPENFKARVSRILVEAAEFTYDNVLDAGLYTANAVFPLSARINASKDQWIANLNYSAANQLTGLEYARPAN